MSKRIYVTVSDETFDRIARKAATDYRSWSYVANEHIENSINSDSLSISVDFSKLQTEITKYKPGK